MSDKSDEFNFDDWRALAESSPELFEQRRRELLQAEIDMAPPALQPRLRGLQWQIDLVRDRCSSPAVASAKLFEMMWDKVYGNNGFLDALTSSGDKIEVPKQLPRAEVLPFRAREQDIE